MSAVQVYSDAVALARAASEHLVTLATEAVSSDGRATIALSGGTTPRATYALLATTEFSARVDWPRVHVFWGDERCVPPDHPDSDYRMAREALLDHVPIPADNVHRIQAELGPAEAAQDYEQTLRSFFAEPRLPRFDLILLGMGVDGHTASLFPGKESLREQTRWVVESYVEELDSWRVTLTPPVINAAAQITFLISGESKAETLRQVFMGPPQSDRLPAQIINPENGGLLWLLDKGAAGLL